MLYQRPRGVNDILPEEVGRWQQAEATFRDLCRVYNYEEIRTPIFEQTELFVRAVGEDTDIVSKEMYTFEDRGGRSLTLQAEGTAPTIRAYLENHLQGQDPERLVKLYYLSPIFRYDRPQAGRYRQHHQVGAEAIGSPRPEVDAEIIQLSLAFFERLGLDEVTLLLNSVGCPACRPDYIEALKSQIKPQIEQLCRECQRRYESNPLRLLDCKNPKCGEIMQNAPVLRDMLCPDCAEHFGQLQGTLDMLSVPYTLDSSIVRGLDYYTKTAFEFVAPGLGAQDSIGGGGRYDGLIEQCGGPPTPAVGVGIGLERVLIAQQVAGAIIEVQPRQGVFVVTIGEEAWPEGLKLLARLRAAGLKAEIDYRQRSVRAQLRYADSEGYQWAAILGEDELQQQSVTLRDMVSGEQESLPQSELITRLPVEDE